MRPAWCAPQRQRHRSRAPPSPAYHGAARATTRAPRQDSTKIGYRGNVAANQAVGDDREPDTTSRVVTSSDESRHLRVLIANERRERLGLLAQVVAQLGHEVIAGEIDVEEVGAVTAREQPDVALVGLGLSSEHALDLIGEIVREAACPVIALLSAEDPAYVHEAAKRGIFAYILNDDPQGLASAIDITLQRFAEYQSLQGAFGRRALIEQAKGILMARQGVNADRAFELLREHSQRTGRKLSDVAAALVESHELLPPAGRSLSSPQTRSRRGSGP